MHFPLYINHFIFHSKQKELSKFDSPIFYKPNTIVEIVKNKRTDTVSTTVVRSGDAISAGSNFNFLAKIGKIPPSCFAKITVTINVNDTVNAIFASFY